MWVYIVMVALSMALAAGATQAARAAVAGVGPGGALGSALQIEARPGGPRRPRLALPLAYYALAAASCLPFAAVSALRSGVGTDWPIYEEMFASISAGGAAFGEPGFNLLNRLVHAISPNFALFVFVTGALTCSIVFRAIYWSSVFVPLSILVFFLDASFFNSMNQIRQMLATAIFLYAFRYARERRLLPYLLWMLAAASIHFIAAVFVPLYFVYGHAPRPRSQFAFLAANAALLYPLGKLAIFVVSKTRYAWYLDSVYADASGFHVAGFLFSLALFLLYWHYGRVGAARAALEAAGAGAAGPQPLGGAADARAGAEAGAGAGAFAAAARDREYELFEFMQCLSCAVVLYTAFVPQIQRLSAALASPALFCVPRMVAKEGDRNRRIVLYIIVVALFGAKLAYDVYRNGWYSAIPYRSVFGAFAGAG